MKRYTTLLRLVGLGMTFVIAACANAAPAMDAPATLAPVTRAPAMPGQALQPGDVVAVCGDSITEQKLYSLFIEEYLLLCQPVANLRAHQFGWGGETASGFRGRIENEVVPYKPAVATTCYGMNDGGYSPMNPGKAKSYYDNQKAVVAAFKKAGVRFIIIGSPGVVDANTFRNSAETATMYNKTLGEERDIAKRIAEEEGITFANVFDPMMDAMTKAKAKYGPSYHVAGGDGVHPDRNGHLIMAYAYLKAMGCNGDLGTITVDLAGNQAQATGGHKVLSAANGTVELESARYPFCFFGNDAKSPNSTRGIVEFFPFNDDLNRLKLVVKGGGAEYYKVTWSGPGSRKVAGENGGAEMLKASKVFAAADLAKGINLAAEFLDNPFYEPFQKAEQAIRAQQDFETPLVKDLLHNMGRFRQMVPEEKDSFDRIQTAALKRDQVLMDASRAAVAPVKHTLTIEKAEAPPPPPATTPAPAAAPATPVPAK